MRQRKSATISFRTHRATKEKLSALALKHHKSVATVINELLSDVISD